MPKVIRLEIAQLVSVINNNTGKEYDQDSWRSQWVRGQGLLLFAESLHKVPGKQFLTFYFTKLEDLVIPVIEDLNTGYGEVIEDNDECIVWKTQNSTYRFEFDGLTLSDTSRKVLREYGDLIAKNTEEKERKKQKGNKNIN